MAVDPKSREFLVHYAKVCLREASARRGRPFANDLLQWAANARRQAAAARPAQGELF